MKNRFLRLLAFSYSLCSIGAHYAHLDKNWSDDLVYDLVVGQELNLTCRSSSKRIAFYIVGISGEIHNGSRHGDIFPGSNPFLTEVSKDYDEFGYAVFERSLLLTVVAKLNNTALQCGGTEFIGNRLTVVYSRGALFRARGIGSVCAVECITYMGPPAECNCNITLSPLSKYSVEDKGEISRITDPPPYVDFTLVDHGEGGRGGAHKWHAECDSSSKHIAFCVIGAQCDSEYIHGLPNGSNFSLSCTLGDYSDESGRTFYRRNLELNLAAEPDSILLALQCKAGKDKEAYTRALVLKGLQRCPSPSEGAYDYLCGSGLSPMLRSKMMTALVLTAVFAAWCKL